MSTRPVPRSYSAALLATVLSLGTIAIAHAQYPHASLRDRPDTSYTLQQPAASALSAEALREIAVDAYLYAYPMVLMEMARRVATNVSSPIDGRAPMNQFGHRTAIPDAGTPNVIWPNTDTLYSNLWFDVSREPLVIHIPEAGNRYYTLSMLDMWTDMFAARGPRTSGSGQQTFAIVGPAWQGVLPAGMELVRSPTETGWLINQVQTDGPADNAAVNQFQAGMSATPFSQWGKPYVMTGAGMVNPGWDTQSSPLQQVATMDAATFFTIFADVLRRNPPHANDYPTRERLRRIGLGYEPFSFTRLDPAVQQALTEARPIAGRRIVDTSARLGTSVNGWNTILHGLGAYGTDYDRRAGVAYVGLGATTPQEVLYPVAVSDAKGNPLVSNKRYVVHFDKAQLPPVHAFWSMNLYDQRNGFAENREKRYAVRSTDALRYNTDGSLDVYIQRKRPSDDMVANWLPTPEKGPFILNMRMYWPKEDALDGSWVPPAVRTR